LLDDLPAHPAAGRRGHPGYVLFQQIGLRDSQAALIIT
jgi:hypothetical protein